MYMCGWQMNILIVTLRKSHGMVRHVDMDVRIPLNILCTLIAISAVYISVVCISKVTGCFIAVVFLFFV